jgi:hypothetical protein
MSNISSVTGTNTPYQTTNSNTLLLQAFQPVGSALQSGDLSSAQSALATVQQDLQTNSSSPVQPPFGRNSLANSAYQTLAGALQSGNLAAAQKAFVSLQTALSSPRKAGGGSSATQPPTSAGAATQTNSTSNTTSSSATDDGGDDDGSGLNVTA